MKYSVILLIFSISTVFAQGNLNQNWTIKTDILLPIITHFHETDLGTITLERLFKRQSVQLTCLGFHEKPTEIFGQDRHTFQVIPEYKFFLLQRKQSEGFYLGGYCKYSLAHTVIYTINGDNPADKIELEYKEKQLGIGTSIGYQRYLYKKLVIDALLGWGVVKQIKIDQIKGELFDSNLSYWGDARAAINLGWKF